jgi:hypothetical protein
LIIVADLSCSQRRFPLRLASWFPGRYASYLRWLSHLVDRLGADRVLALWQEVHEGYDDELLSSILATGWCVDEQADIAAAEEHIAALLAQFFPTARKDIDQAQARLLAEQTPPIRQIRRAFPSLTVRRETTAYEALHLACDGLALLVEALIRSYGKQGELIAYDVLRAERIAASGGCTGSVAEFVADFTAQPHEANLFTAGLITEVMRVSERGVELHVKECEWARYYRERHPQVGYLMACSTDEAAYRAFNPTLRLQRTTTLMEGGQVCDFRIYALDAARAR